MSQWFRLTEVKFCVNFGTFLFQRYQFLKSARAWNLSWVATVVFIVRLLHAFGFSKKLPWLTQASVIDLKTQTHAINARWKRLSKLSFIHHKQVKLYKISVLKWEIFFVFTFSKNSKKAIVLQIKEMFHLLSRS